MNNYIDFEVCLYIYFKLSFNFLDKKPIRNPLYRIYSQGILDFFKR